MAADQAASPSSSAESQQFLSLATALLADENHFEFISLVASHMDLVFSKSTAQGDRSPCMTIIMANSSFSFYTTECICICSILVHTLVKLPTASVLPAAKTLAQAFSSKVDDRADERLSALFSLHEVTHDPEVQLAMILAAASYASR